MEAIVLAGGFGTRLKAVVPDLPKPMAPVAGRPFLEIVLSTLARTGFTHVVLSLGYKADLIRNHFGDRFAGMSLTHEVEPAPLGTGGAIRRAMRSCTADHVYIFNGDTYLEIEAPQIEALWHTYRQPIILAREVPDTTRYGRLDIWSGRIQGFLEKGSGGPGLINAGCYVLPSDALAHFPEDTPFSIETDFLARTVQEQPVRAFVTQSRFIDIGIPEDYARAQYELRDSPPLP